MVFSLVPRCQGLAGSQNDHDHRVDEPLGALIRTSMRLAYRPSAPKCLCQFPFEATAGLEVQRLVDRFVAHTHALVIRIVLDQTMGNLLW